MTPDNRTPLLLSLAALIFLLVFGFGYALPRANANRQLEAKIAAIQKSQGEIVALLPEASRSKVSLPRPQPDVAGWAAQNLLSGLERRLVANNPYKGTDGAEIKLSSLTPAEVTTLMSGLAAVNLIIKRMSLSDRIGRGVWDLDLFVEIPEALK